MCSEWQTHTVGDFLTLEYGKPLDKKDRKVDGLYPAYGANGIKARSDKYLCESKAIIIGRKGSAGELTITEDRFWPLDVTYFVKFDTAKYDLTFVYYLLSLLSLPDLATGVKPGINRNKVYAIKVKTPSLFEQQRIVAILDQAFADIEKARANAEKNLKNARELFDSYLNQVFSKEAVLSGCPLVALSDCCIIRPPKSEAKAMLKSDDHVSFVPMDSLGINRKSLFLDKTKKLEDVSGSYTYFADGDVLLAKITPCFENGKLGIAKGLKNGIGFGSSEFIVFRPDERLEAEYLYYFLNQQAFRDDGQAMMTGAVGHKRVPKDFIENIKIPLRTVYEQQLIVSMLDKQSVNVQKLTTCYESKLASLDELKKSLLQKAFSGELTKTEGHAA
jgi:type I restriction enzyme S subunit